MLSGLIYPSDRTGIRNLGNRLICRQHLQSAVLSEDSCLNFFVTVSFPPGKVTANNYSGFSCGLN
jgi:hypothetical protein